MERNSMAKYGKRSQQLVGKEMHKFKQGKLKNRKQAIAIGLSEAREQGVKVPPRPKRKRK
jgi:hypothetical protein